MKENKSKIKKFFQSIFKIFFYTLFKLKHGTIVFDEKIQSKRHTLPLAGIAKGRNQ